ncbi:MAG: ABC transporter ATP-binding protein [Candidatus Sumerlaeia bacterium]|nr:ABC transporter ATP-binding protein [Candidatus Sumerlaeia bacterium]
MTSDPIIQVSGLSFAYGKTPVLNDLSFQIGRGATGLLGPNGAGKTTLLKILLGFLRPARGSGAVLGIPIGRRGVHIRQRIGYMPEHDCLIPSLKAVRLVAYCGELYGLPWAEAMQRAHEVLFYVGLGEARYREVGTFSTGMKQRIKLAQALVASPDVLFLDEPTNGLDPSGRQEMLQLIKDVVAQGETSVIFSSHILHDVEAACTDVVMIKKGRVVVSGKIEDLKRVEEAVVEVRWKSAGDGDGFVQALAREGCRCEPGRNDLLRVTLPPGKGTEVLFRVARASGVQIRHLMRKRDSLEDVFLSAIEEQN